MKSKRLREIDMLRAIAFFFVIMQHSLGGTVTNIYQSVGNLTIANVFMVIAEPGVPIFLFISGLTTTYTYKNNIDIKKYYKNRFLYLIIPYFIFSYVNMILHNPDKIHNFLSETLVGGGAFHLWYMGMFIRLVLIFPVLIYIGKWIHKRNIIFRIITFIIIFRGYIYISIHQMSIKSEAAKFLFGSPTEWQIRFVNLSIVFWGIYVIFGMYAAFNYDKFKEIIIKYRFVVYGVFILTFYYKFYKQFDFLNYNILFDIGYRTSNILMFYIVSEYILKRNLIAKIMSAISKYSYVGYMIHVYVLYKCIFYFQGIGITNPILNAIISSVCAILIATLAVYEITLIPKSKIITGVKDNFKDLKIFVDYIKNRIRNTNYYVS